MKLKTIVESISSKFEPNAFQIVMDAGWEPYAYEKGKSFVSHDYRKVPDMDAAEESDKISFKIKDSFTGQITIALPKKYPISGLRMLELINSKQKVDSAFVNLSKYMTKVLNNSHIYAYPASYGIGVSNLYNPMRQNEIDTITKILSDLGLEYKTELSDGHWVTRFKVSKNSNNTKILNKL